MLLGTPEVRFGMPKVCFWVKKRIFMMQKRFLGCQKCRWLPKVFFWVTKAVFWGPNELTGASNFSFCGTESGCWGCQKRLLVRQLCFFVSQLLLEI